MNALDTIINIAETNLVYADLRYCLVAKDKKPYKVDGTLARPNVDEDFIDLEQLTTVDVSDFAGVGISITASNISAIDVDHCFLKPFDISTADNRAKDTIERFKDFAYIEFSFSGTGLRVLFKSDNILNYTDKYYIKNSNNHIEFYQPCQHARYVTITGRVIVDNKIEYFNNLRDIMISYLDDYMLRPKNDKSHIDVRTETRTLTELIIETKRLYLKDSHFQSLWFGKAPGSGKNESELDYQLIAYLFEHITQDREMIRQIFEQSNYYKSKDYKHLSKWSYNDYRYYNYQYDSVRRHH